MITIFINGVEVTMPVTAKLSTPQGEWHRNGPIEIDAR
jgi:hypothetical protein